MEILPFCCAAACLFAPALGQWSTDGLQHLAVSDAASDQNQPKIKALPAGGAWVSWFDGIGTGWDVRIQRLDRDGVEAFAHNGLLVADRGFSSTQDYGLDTDGLGNALLAYRMDAGGGTEIWASKVSRSGTLEWGSGVVLASGAGFVAAPAICGLIDGSAVVAWTENSNVRVQRLNPQGVPQWGSGVMLAPPAGSYSVADVQSDGAEAIVSIVHQTGNFTSPKHLVAQKLTGAGSPAWGSAPIAVFDGGSLQFGNFPDFVTDGLGGAVFSWYSSSPALQCFVQRIDAVGGEYWAHNGLAVSTNGGQVRVAPQAEYDRASGDVFLAWTELNSSQSMRGISAQRIDAQGNRLWGSAGTTIVPLSSTEVGQATVAPDGLAEGALVFWETSPAFDQDTLHGVHLGGAGAIDVPSFFVAQTPSGKSRLAATVSTLGPALLVWSDNRNDGGDILAQAVRPNGDLGGIPVAGSPYCVAKANSSGVPATIEALGDNLVGANRITLVTSDLPVGQFGFYLNSQTQGFVANPAGSVGHLCLAVSIGRYNAAPEIFFSGPFGLGILALDLTNTPTPVGPTTIAAGQTWNFQAWYRDTGAAGSTSNFTAGVSVVFQ